MKKSAFITIMTAFTLLLLVACTSDSPDVVETPIVTETPPVTETPSVFSEGLAEGELFFNEPEITEHSFAVWISYSVQDFGMTEEQLRELFPYIDWGLDYDIGLTSATLGYREDGTLVELLTRPISSHDGPPHRFGIRFWLDGFGNDYETFEFPTYFTPKVSNIYGVSVVAYMHHLWRDELIRHFRAEFEMDGYVFRITFDDHIESGQELMAKIVKGIIRTGMDVFLELRTEAPIFTEGLAEGELHFNEPEITKRALVDSDCHNLTSYRHTMTEEQLRETFYYIDLQIHSGVTVGYKADGTLSDLTAHLQISDSSFPSMVEIQFWPEGFSCDTEIFGFPTYFIPKISNIYSVPVVAYMHNLWGDEYEAAMVEFYGQPARHFRTEFEMDGFMFLITFNDLIEPGQERMTEIVNGIIRTGIEVFTDLRRDGE